MNKEEVVNIIIEKLGTYQILTNVLPGIFFCKGLVFFLDLDFSTESIVEDLIIYYFIGFIINRIGSLFVEPFLRKVRFLKFSSYSDFISASKNDVKIDMLSEINNYMRDMLTSTLMLLLVMGAQNFINISSWFSNNWSWVLLIFILVIFLFSYRKQTSYLKKRVETARSQ